MKRSNYSPLFTLALTTFAVVAMLALMIVIGAPRAGAHAGAQQAVAGAPAHESETAQATETQHPEGTQTAQATETQHPEGTQTAQATETHHPEGTRTAQATQTHEPEGSETPEATETQHPEGTQTAQATQTHEPEGSETPEATETQHPEGSHTTETQHPEGSHTPQATETQHPEGSHTPEATHTPRPETTRTLTLDPRLQFANVHPGDTRSYDFDLRNRGASADQISLDVTSLLGWTVAASPASVLLAPNAHTPVHVTVSVPGSANGNLDVETLVATDGTNTATSFVVLLTEERAFSDLNTQNWAWNPVQFLASQSVVSGYADGTFRPNNTVTRAQFAKMLVNGMGWALVQPAHASFSDVPAGNWAYAYVETAVQHGTLAGYADGTFRPNTNITRGQLAKLIVAARGWTPVQPTQATFSDVPATYWAYSFIETTVDSGVLGGYADGTFRPAAPATRAQVAKILANGLILSQH